ncbi:hypothetical protein ACNKHK_25145 [Shigella flexneri]
MRGAKTMAETRAEKEVAYLSYQLATIKTDVELELTCEQLEVVNRRRKNCLACLNSMNSNVGLLTLKRVNGYRRKGSSGETARNYCRRLNA